jgi:hypothetical protein
MFAGPDLSGWTAEPTSPDPAFEALGRAHCIDRFPDHRAELADAHVLHDQRGPNGADILWYTDRYEASAFVYRTESGGLQAPGCAYSDHGEGVWVDRPDLAIMSWGSGSVSGTQGVVDPDAARVVLETEGGREIVASSADGHFIAWWPFDDEVAMARSYDAAGGLLSEAARPEIPD